MDLPLHLLEEPFQVFITTGADISDLGGTTYLTPRESYGLWHFIDGTVEIYRGSGNPKQQPPHAYEKIPSGSCYLTQPGQRIVFRVPQGTRHRRVSFAVRHGPRKSGGKGLSRYPTDGNQPLPKDFFRTELPFIVPEPLTTSAKEVLERCSSWWWRSVSARLRANHLLHGWFLELLFLQSAGITESNKSWLQKLDQFVCENLARGLTIQDLARFQNISLSTMARQLHKTTGLTPTEYLNRHRKIITTDLLKDSRLSIREVATLSGFSNPDSYGRWFRKTFAETPSSFRHRLI